MILRAIFKVILILFLTTPFVSSLDIEIETIEINPIVIENNNYAEYKIKIENKEPDDRFRVSVSSPYNWVVLIEPTPMDVNQHEEITFSLKLKPIYQTESGVYFIPIKIKSRNNESFMVEKEFKAIVKTYDEAIYTDLIKSSNINPTEENLFKINIKNNFNVKISDLDIKLESEFFSLEKKINLSELGDITENFVVNFSGNINEGEHPIYIRFYSNNNLVLEREYSMNLGYYPNIEGIETPSEKFLFSSEKIVKTNNGNTISHEIYSIELSSFDSLITFVSPEPTSRIKENRNYILTWEFDLNPGETKEILIIKNYRKPTFSLLLLILVLGLIYSHRKKEIELTKDVLSIKQSRDGILSMDIVISLKNKSRRTLKNLKLLDTIHNLIDEPSHFGNKKPQIIKSNLTTRMLWNIPSLKGKSNFVVSYNLRVKHHRISSVRIPKAVAKYLKLNKKIIIYSNRVKPF